MELYTLDGAFRRTEVVDQFESLIWTERFSATGDFQLVIPSTSKYRSILGIDQTLALNESDRVMRIDSIEKKDDSEGRSLLTITGPSLEDVLSDRAARSSMAVLASDFKWTVSGTPGAILRQLFQMICVDGMLDLNDRIPFIAQGSLYPGDTIPEPGLIITMTLTPGTLYDTIKNICDSYGLGFRLTRNGDKSQLFFNIYAGSDRTSIQNQLPAVIFSPQLENMQDTTALTSTKGYKNVAYVFSPRGNTTVYASGYENVTGFDRRVLMVDASDLDATLTGSALLIELQRRGYEALEQNKSLQALDGEISQYSMYKYRKDYNLGDLVESRDITGLSSFMRVTEQIFASDDQGDRSYPTLTTDLFINPGSWYSSTGAHIWNDVQGTWATVI